MRLRLVSAALVALAVVTVSCSENSITGPNSGPASSSIKGPSLVISPPAVPAVRISELHYDNASTDVGEAVEISGPAGMRVQGWKVIFYNGNGGAAYDSVTFTGNIPATCGARGVISIARAGIQNGDPDGLALIDSTRAVIEFLSYEGVFTATTGPATGMVSREMGVREAGNEAIGQSLRRNSAGTWFSDAPSTFGACNDDTTPPADSAVATVTELPATATLVPNATQQMTATAKNASSVTLAGAMIGWTSTNPSVASVDVNGLVKALAIGTTNIVAMSTNGMADTSAITVNAAPPPSGLSNVRFSEIHYDNTGTDADEKIEIEGPAGGDLTGWSVVLYNGDNGQSYNTQTLNVTIPATCTTRGVVVLSYPTNGIQNGAPDGFALVNSGGQVVQFLSYEGTMTAANGPAQGLLSTDIGVLENSAPVGRSLQTDSAGVWYGPYPNTFGACNPLEIPPPSIFFSGRVPSDVALPVGFQDQLFASLQDVSGNSLPATFTWTSETPSIATIDADGVFTALDSGSATFRATSNTGATATWTLPTTIAKASTTANYAGNTEFGVPADADNTDDFIIVHPEYTSSFNKNRGTPNWVSYDLDASHFGPQDRCDCFTFDPAAAGIATPYTTNAYTGSAAINGFGIDRGHLARSFDRTSGSLDNAYTFYFSNIVPQASDLNQGPWANMENYLGDLARFSNKEVYIIAGVAGDKGTLKNEGKVVIPEFTWKVALILPRDEGLADVHSYSDVQVIAAVMPNNAGVRNVDWHTYETTVDSVEALSGYDLLALLPDPIEIAVESNTVPPVAATDGPYSGYLPGENISMSGAGSSDADAGQTLTYAWDFGDGSTGTGVSVTHAYASAGTFNVQLIVTDPLGLADTVTTTATVQTQAQGTGDAKTIVAGLDISAGNAKSLNAKLDAATAAFDRGDTGAAVNQLNALLNEIDAMVTSGRLSSTDAAPLITLINRIITSA
ncbi:MAG: DNA/RNA non-specific endonuclease [Gemmatimonas sp.]